MKQYLFLILVPVILLSNLVRADERIWDLRKIAIDAKAASEDGDLNTKFAFDGDLNTRWSSKFADNQWIYIDLGKACVITEIKLCWETAYAKEYQIQVSEDAAAWAEVKCITKGQGGDETFTFENLRARFIRLNCIRRATSWGFSLYEVIIYGPQTGKEPEHGGLITPRAISTDYDRNWRELDKYFAEQIAADPKNSRRLTDDAFLDLIERRAFDYFWYEVSPNTFFVADSTTWKTHASISGIGFQLGAYIAGHYRKYRSQEEIYQRVEKLLDNCWDDPNDPNDLCLEHHEGWAYHWVNIETGKWEGHEHVCTHDSIMYLCGVIAAKRYFAGTKAGEIAAKILDSVDWKWIIHDGFNKRLVSSAYAYTYDPLCGGEVIFYDGMKFDYILPIGGIKSSVPAVYWDNYAQTFPWDSYKGHFWRIERPAIWLHQWDNVWFDFRYMKDRYADYYQNSTEATLANREWCIDNNSYDENLWGISPSLGPGTRGDFFYKNYGAPPDNLPFQTGADNDYTITPNAALGSIVFTPKESIKVARYIYDNYKDKAWKRYGFTDSLNPKKNWFSREYIGIDQGPIILSIENYRSGLIWKYFAKEKTVSNGLDRCGFVGVVDNFDQSEHSQAYGEWRDPDRGECYKYKKSDDYVKEGRFAMEVSYDLTKDSKDRHFAATKYFAVSPARNDFVPYKYLTFWVRGDEILYLNLITADKKIIPLTPKSQVKSFDNWVRHYFELPDKEKDRSIREIRFSVKGNDKGLFYLDDIILTNDIKLEEPDSMLDDFEDNPKKETKCLWVVNEPYKAQIVSDIKHDGDKSLKIDFDKKEDKDKWSCLRAEVDFNDWRGYHSVAMWVYGETEILLKLADKSGRSYNVQTQKAINKDGWTHLFFNIQANLNPNNCWEPRYDKEHIREILIFIEPGGTDEKRTVYLDSIMLTE